MTEHDLLDRLFELFPAFRETWESPANDHLADDGSFTRCGVFGEFTHFYMEHHERLEAGLLDRLGRFVSECAADEGPLGDAAAPCFIENLAEQAAGRTLRPHLTGFAARCHDYWAKPES